ncbi:hypothetical protein ABT263_25060 [Kitasatospora sp. NPDC001603]|uniref:hypothetical protein n=1 Tax=Kitasatospora sp. NPDC001603 TaxID=3154388 RepID=UPI00332C2767
MVEDVLAQQAGEAGAFDTKAELGLSEAEEGTRESSFARRTCHLQLAPAASMTSAKTVLAARGRDAAGRRMKLLVVDHR